MPATLFEGGERTRRVPTKATKALAVSCEKLPSGFRITLPLRLVSEANIADHEHWRGRQRRAKVQRGTMKACLQSYAGAFPGHWPVVVTITRLAPRSLDGEDNLPGAGKHLRDGVADWLGIKDNDPRVSWRYGEAKIGPRTYGTRIDVQWASGSKLPGEVG